MLNTLSAITDSFIQGEKLVYRNSNCADYIITNLFAGYVRVMFSNGNGYTYRARKRDILRLMTDNKISLGFWVNQCLNLDNPINHYTTKPIAYVG